MSLLRIVAIGFIFFAASLAWVVLGGITTSRSSSQTTKLRGAVAELWGKPQAQSAPTLAVESTVRRTARRTEVTGTTRREIEEEVIEHPSRDVALTASDIAVDLTLDQRRKGLAWYSLYDVAFRGAYRYEHRDGDKGTLRITFRFPDAQGVYDDFRISVDGAVQDTRPKDGQISLTVPVTPAQVVAFEVAYRSRGEGEWSYVPAANASSIKDFKLAMTTDFADVDFPPMTMSPSLREAKGRGTKLEWRFSQVVTGHGIGMVMPKRLQPGELAAAMAFSAPVSLLFFFLVMFVLALVKNIDLHPMNYLFLAGAFFGFHLLFAYSVDHLPVVPAFAICSAVSVLLVVSYLRLVVSARFAFVEAAAAELVYLVGFSLAHFWEGFTGLTVTVLSLVTLFVLMQATGRVRWGAAAGRAGATAT